MARAIVTVLRELNFADTLQSHAFILLAGGVADLISGPSQCCRLHGSDNDPKIIDILVMNLKTGVTQLIY